MVSEQCFVVLRIAPQKDEHILAIVNISHQINSRCLLEQV